MIDDLLEYCQTHIPFTLNWNIVSQSKYIKMKDIENNQSLPWNWDFVSQNPNITPRFIEKYSHILSFCNITKSSFTFAIRVKDRCCVFYFLNKIKKLCPSIRRYIVESYL